VLEDDEWVLFDMGSRNGTIVNGKFVTRHALAHNDEIRIGDAVFKFVVEGAEKFVPYRIDGSVRGACRASLLPELVGGYQMDHIAAEIERIAPTELSSVVLGESGA